MYNCINIVLFHTDILNFSVVKVLHKSFIFYAGHEKEFLNFNIRNLISITLNPAKN